MITRATIDEQYAICRAMYREGRMPKEMYLKCVIALAYEFAVMDQMEDTRILLSECDEPYLREVLPIQMAEDQTFYTVALYLARKLSERGVPSISDDDLLLAFSRTAKA